MRTYTLKEAMEQLATPGINNPFELSKHFKLVAKDTFTKR